MAESDDSHVLKPTQMAKSSEGKSPTDKFGQNYKSDKDVSKWSDTGPALTRKAHSRSDVDLSARSLHHTLGVKHSQASPGDHSHDGKTSKKLGSRQLLPGGTTEPEWSLPNGYVAADIVTLINRFVDFRILGAPGYKSGIVLVSFTALAATTRVVTFPDAYPVGVTPKVFTNISSGAGETLRWYSRASSVSNTQFTINLAKTDAADPSQTWANIPVHWFATA